MAKRQQRQNMVQLHNGISPRHEGECNLAICSDLQRCGNSGGKVGGDGDTEKEEPRVLSREYGNWLVCLYNVEWNSGH